MTTLSLRTAALAIAAGGLTLTAPAAAVPADHARTWAQAASAYGDMTYQNGRDDDDDDDHDDDRGRYRGWGNNDRDHDGRYRGYRGRGYQQRGYNRGYYGEPAYRNTRVWQGHDGRYYCRRSDGTTGLLIGGAAGALVGREIAGRGGDRTLGAILGAAGGALLGRKIDSGMRCR